MSEGDKERRDLSKSASEDEAAEPSGPMGTGDPEEGDSKPMGTESTRTNKEAASHDEAGEGNE